MNKKFKRVFVIVILLLTLIFVIVNSTLGKIDNLAPNGNIDIFDINIEHETDQTDDTFAETDTIIDENNNQTNKDSNSSKDKEETDKQEDVDNRVGLIVEDNNDEFVKQNKLKIFENSAFTMKNKIAPGSTNTYNFIIKNNNSFTIKYKIKMIEDNPHNINMKYRLKLNDQYIIGSENMWFSAESLDIDYVTLLSRETSSYSLDWKWFDSDNDTQIGEEVTDKYKLSINITAEEIS